MGGNLIKENGCLVEGVSKDEFTTNITNLQSEKLDKFTKIIYSDLNTLTETGVYYCQTASTNKPSGNNGYLFVQKYADGYTYQRFVTVNTAICYERVFNNSIWTNWREVLYKLGGNLTEALNTLSLYPQKSNTYSIGSGNSYYKNAYFTNYVVYGATGQKSIFTTMYPDSPRTVITTNTNGLRLLIDATSAFAPIEASAFNQQSSRRYKENIIDMSEEEANKIDNINVVKFDYKIKENGTNMAGVIAEDIYEILPNVVTTANIDGEELPDSVDYAKIVPYLLKNVQMLKKDNQMLKKRVSELENNIVEV